MLTACFHVTWGYGHDSTQSWGSRTTNNAKIFHLAVFQFLKNGVSCLCHPCSAESRLVPPLTVIVSNQCSAAYLTSWISKSQVVRCPCISTGWRSACSCPMWYNHLFKQKLSLCSLTFINPLLEGHLQVNNYIASYQPPPALENVSRCLIPIVS